MNNQVHAVRGMARPTMKDVAFRAGVALKTVSRVVNGEPGVTPETTKRVRGAIEDLGFRRNESARLLRTGRTATLGFIADNCGDPDYAAVCRGVEEVARDHGFLVFTGSTDGDPDREESLALALCARRVDGLILAPAPGDHAYLAPEIEAGVATVFVLRPPELAGRDVVLADERGGAKAAVAHLIAQGHRRIGFLGGDLSGYRSRQLMSGYAEAMAAGGLPADPAWTTLAPQRLADSAVTAVLCGSREHTLRALRAIAAAGHTRTAPGRTRRVAVVGFGDFELADLVSPGVTVVSYDPAAIGRTAGELLIRRITGEDGPARRVELPTRLIPRGSAEFPPQE
ncbi:LacI family DNA-binding transcriptional regulator [Trebonia sp.]|uniref:LacI family DNA-binding transcriptional regulator n=1 Tax=Trebonia sp. TaxID=2767075 RepID=UPI002617B25B|nr:LacI family DNA-binding transcriptional regulator [Trebonia sp.]